jgi:hypothetical protein
MKPNPKEILDQTFLEMRWRCLSLAADLDRLQRAGALADERVEKFRSAVRLLLAGDSNRAEQVQLLFSDPVK